MEPDAIHLTRRDALIKLLRVAGVGVVRLGWALVE